MWFNYVWFDQEYYLVDESPRLLSQLNSSLDLKLYLKAGRKYQTRRIFHSFSTILRKTNSKTIRLGNSDGRWAWCNQHRAPTTRKVSFRVPPNLRQNSTTRIDGNTKGNFAVGLVDRKQRIYMKNAYYNYFLSSRTDSFSS